MSNAHDSELLFNFAPGGAVASSDSKGAPIELPTFDINSSEPLPETPADGLSPERFRTPQTQTNNPAPTVGPPPVDDAEREAGEIWLHGDVILCGCPDCRAPMTVRTWLMVADCWRCGTSIELSEEQEKIVRRLLKQQEGNAPKAESPTPASNSNGSAPPDNGKKSPPVDAVASAPAVQTPKSAPTPKPEKRVAENEQPSPTANGAAPTVDAPREMQRRRRKRAASNTQARRRAPLPSPAKLFRQAVGDFFRNTPAWVVSLVIHCLLLTLLALWTLPDDDGEEIVISSSVDPVREEGTEREAKFDVANFDLPIPNELDITDPQVRDTVIKADQDAQELRVDPDAIYDLPDLNAVRNQIETQSGSFASVAARDPRVRVEMIQREGGTTLTEAAVSRGLRFLSLHQNENGSWHLNRFNRSCNCRDPGTVNNDVAATSMVLLPYLGAGQTHLVGRYKTNVARGLRWLLDHQLPSGGFSPSVGNSHMYAHGQAAIVLCEAYFMTGDQNLRDAAQRSIDYIVKAQHQGGGWRYKPGEAGDTSVVGWQLMALHSAKVSGLNVPPATMELASHFLDSVQSNDGAQYAYLPGGRRSPTPTMTAEALLCRMYLGRKLDHIGLQKGVKILSERYPPDNPASEMYYWYYGTQTMHHVGGDAWEKWNFKMRDILVNTQEKKGHQAGSWTPVRHHDRAGGRIYMTALGVCTLEVYYRHLPIFRQIDLEGELTD